MKTELKIEVGKFYKARDGRKVRIYAVDGGGTFPIHGAAWLDNEWTLRVYTTNGRYHIGFECKEDIISEWVEKFPRNGEPAWATHRAMDQDGVWYWYSEAPSLRGGNWRSGEQLDIIPKSHAPEFTGDWKDSLQELE